MSGNTHRPVLDLPRSGFDLATDAVGLLGVIVSIVAPMAYWSRLPETIPTHFNFAGEVDGTGPRAMIALFPAIALIMFVGFTILSRFPHVFNYLVAITESNAEAQYRNAQMLLAILKSIIAWLFCGITWQTIQISRGAAARDFGWFILVMIGLITAAIIVFVVRSLRFR